MMGGGGLIYIREDIPCKELKSYAIELNLEGIFLEINPRKCKWLLFGGYNYNKANIDTFLGHLEPILDYHMTKLENVLLLSDFNSEMKEACMNEFCETYNLINLIDNPTCLTNKFRSFQNSLTIKTGQSDHHKMTVTVMRSFFPEQVPTRIIYRDFKMFDNSIFRTEFQNRLSSVGASITYTIFESIFMEQLNKQAPVKEKYVRANNAAFMNKTLSKAIMNRSRLRNKYLKHPNIINKSDYEKQRNYCVNLLKDLKELCMTKFTNT